MVRRLLLVGLLVMMAACTSTDNTLYNELGGQQKVTEIVDNFISEIEYDPAILSYFRGSDIGRFRTKLTEQLCFVSGGNCVYTGDTMAQVHGGMHISETDFNRTVDLLIIAMNKAKVPHRLQNRLLAELAPMRSQMLYR